MNRNNIRACLADLVKYTTVVALLLGAAGAVQAESQQSWLQAVQAEEAVYQHAPPAAEVEAEGYQKPLPLSFGLDYTLVSDYLFRGVNFSEYDGEGREKLNHQLNVWASVDMEEVTGYEAAGSLNVATWFQWYAGNDDEPFTTATGQSEDHLQEVDYTISWSNEMPLLYTAIELGYTAFQFPQLSGDAQCTHELWAHAEFDDSALWRGLGFAVEQPVLNPYVYYGFDIDDASGGQYMELGVSHDLLLSRYGFEDTPVLRNLTVTPSVAVGGDHRYYQIFDAERGKHTQLAFINYGLSLAYDLSDALGIPEQYGALSTAGFLNYNQGLGVDVVDDTLYGGMTVAWEW